MVRDQVAKNKEEICFVICFCLFLFVVHIFSLM